MKIVILIPVFNDWQSVYKLLENNNNKGSNNKINGPRIPKRTRSSKIAEKSEKMLHGNKMMQDFANKLSQRLKFLKPIK